MSSILDAKMSRRTVLAGMASLATIAIAGCGSGNAQQAATTEAAATTEVAATNVTGKTTEGVVTTTVDMSSYEQGKTVRVWLPVAQDYDYQTVTDVTFDAPGAAKSEVTTDDNGNKMLYLEWGADAAPADRTATMSFHAVRQEARVSNIEDDGSALPTEMDEFLEGSKLVPINDQVKEAADEIVAGKEDSVSKARAIYDWVIANMNRDEDVKGCGQGDVCALLSSRAGKCTDINSVFVGLCRAAGVPAREMFGVRMNADDITKNQHCWAEFYANGTGWVPADPADVLKAVLKNNWTKDQEETKEKAEYFWGGYDSERVQLSFGRDVTLNPAQDAEALNYFGYPYGEVDGAALDSYDPENFSYAMSFKADE